MLPVSVHNCDDPNNPGGNPGVSVKGHATDFYGTISW